MTNTETPAAPRNTEEQLVRPWFIWGRRTLTFWDRLRMLCGWHLYIRFDSPDGNCHAACDLSHKITRAEYERVKWPNVPAHAQATPAATSRNNYLGVT